MVSLIGDWARIVGFAPQRCRHCDALRPLDQLVALVEGVGVLVGWECRGACDDGE